MRGPLLVKPPAMLTAFPMSLDETRAVSPQDLGRVPTVKATLVVVHSPDKDHDPT